MATLKRLQKEYENINKDTESCVSASPISNNDLYKWTGIILGPKDTPYEEGIFKLNINFQQLKMVMVKIFCLL